MHPVLPERWAPMVPPSSATVADDAVHGGADVERRRLKLRPATASSEVASIGPCVTQTKPVGYDQRALKAAIRTTIIVGVVGFLLLHTAGVVKLRYPGPPHRGACSSSTPSVR